MLKKISKTYGQQSIIASIDYKKINNKYEFYIKNGKQKLKIDAKNYLSKLNNYPIGEIIMNSIDRDGTGNGLDFEILKTLPKKIKKSIIISGGCGNALHLSEGLKNKKVDAVSTANLLNFLGDGLKKARENMLKNKFNLPKWDVNTIKYLKGGIN